MHLKDGIDLIVNFAGCVDGYSIIYEFTLPKIKEKASNGRFWYKKALRLMALVAPGYIEDPAQVGVDMSRVMKSLKAGSKNPPLAEVDQVDDIKTSYYIDDVHSTNVFIKQLKEATLITVSYGEAI